MQDKFLKPGQRFVFLDPGTRERRQFAIVRALGRGAFAQSFLASGEEGYAVLKSSVNAEGENVDLEAEAQILSELSHPNVVRYYGTAFDHQWRIVLAFERLFDNPLLLYNHVVDVKKLESHPGGRYHPLPVSTCLDQLMDLLLGLESMQESGYVHADVKPANFMIHLGHEQEEEVSPRTQLEDLRGDRGRGVLIDLGGAWSTEALEAHNAGESERGPQLTPLYAPPEAVLDDNLLPGGRGRLLHPSMDTYSAALVFYLTLTGQAPYAHLEASTGGALLKAKRHERRGELSPIDPAAIRALSGFEVRGMRERELTDRIVELLADWLNPDPERRTAVSKARQQLEEAFDFARTPAGLLRQRVAKGELYLPPLRPSERVPSGRVVSPRRGPGGRPPAGDSSRVTKRIKPPRGTTRKVSLTPDSEATPGMFSGRAGGPRSGPKARKGRDTGVKPRPPRRSEPGPARPQPKASPEPTSAKAPPARRGAKPTGSAQRPRQGQAGPARRRAGAPRPGTVFWLQSPVFPQPFPLQRDRSYVLGRAGKADLPIPSDLISRRHAALTWKDGRLILEDLGSTNGTTLEGKPLDAQRPTPLRHGARFSLGGFEIEVFELPRGQDPSIRSLDPEASTRHLKLLRPAPSS